MTTAPKVFADPDALARHAAGWLLELALAASDRPFAVALSGGDTPRRLYTLMASPAWRERFPWERMHWFWGDERFVPPDDPRSNYRMAHDALLAHVPIPPANIHAMPTEGVEPALAASAYEGDLQAFYGASGLDPARPLFDVVLLGLGEDGHTASLFPGSPLLGEYQRWVAASVGEKPEARLTLTYPALDSCRHAAFLVSGTGKRATLALLAVGDAGLPASRVHPQGTLCIFADAAAALPP